MKNAPTHRCPLCDDPGALSLTTAAGFYQCTICDLRFLQPELRLSPTEEAARYRTHNNDLNDPGYRAFLQPLFSSLTVRLKPQARGLDYGCGPGPLLAQMFSEAGYTMDIYDPLFAPQLPAPEARYDFITCSEVAEHMFNPLTDFRRLRQWLRPGGWLGVMTALVEPPVDFKNWYYRRDPTHVIFFSRRTFTWLATHLNFTEVHFISDRLIQMRVP